MKKSKQSVAVLGLATIVVASGLYLSGREQPVERPESTHQPSDLPATSTAIPQAENAAPAPTLRAARMSGEEAIELVSSQRSIREPGRTLANIAGEHWTAEYRGDGTWIVRAGEPAWLVLEDGRAAMPANVAAINLQGADRGPRAR